MDNYNYEDRDAGTTANDSGGCLGNITSRYQDGRINLELPYIKMRYHIAVVAIGVDDNVVGKSTSLLTATHDIQKCRLKAGHTVNGLLRCGT